MNYNGKITLQNRVKKGLFILTLLLLVLV